MGVMRYCHFVEMILLQTRNRMHLFLEYTDGLDRSASELGP
jgi:hypothetical protein